MSTYNNYPTTFTLLTHWKKYLWLLGILLLLLSPPFFVVDPTDMAGVRRFGKVRSTEPVEPGLHFRIPFIDDVDKLQVSLDIFKVEDLTVYTIDNQWVKVSISLSYKIPPEAVLKLLYQVGRSGNFDIANNLRPVTADRALRVFAKRNTIKISEERETIATEMQKSIAEKLKEIFGITVVDLQISKIEYSPTFVASVEAAVKAKNDAIAAENTVNRIRYEADQLRAKAAGQADAVRTQAKGDSDAVLIKIEAEAKAIKMRGEAVANAMTLKAQALNANPKLVDQTMAENWNGQMPTTLLGGSGSFMPLLDLSKKQ